MLLKSCPFMPLAVKEARKNLKTLDGGPFGACVVKNGKVIALARNTVLRNQDPTCHAEINAIRMAAKKLGTFDLSGCDIYSTTEPCPMCFSAIHWARIRSVYYVTTTRDAQKAGFNELMIRDTLLKRLGKSKVLLKKIKDETGCAQLFTDWKKLKNKTCY